MPKGPTWVHPILNITWDPTAARWGPGAPNPSSVTPSSMSASGSTGKFTVSGVGFTGATGLQLVRSSGTAGPNPVIALDSSVFTSVTDTTLVFNLTKAVVQQYVGDVFDLVIIVPATGTGILPGAITITT